jgi:hypothetical protein
LFEAIENSTDPDSPYLLIQRQFEMPDDGKCYIETHDEKYIGHYRLRHVDFTPSGITVEFGRAKSNIISVNFSISASEFEEAMTNIKVITGEIEPPLVDFEPPYCV